MLAKSSNTELLARSVQGRLAGCKKELVSYAHTYMLDVWKKDAKIRGFGRTYFELAWIIILIKRHSSSLVSNFVVFFLRAVFEKKNAKLSVSEFNNIIQA